MSSSDDLPLDRTPAGPSGDVTRLSPLVRRVIAPNPGPFTFTGTCSYIVGEGSVAVIDPGPDDAGHVAALLAALRFETVEAILVTHTHRDHSPAARLLQDATGAPIIGCAKHVPDPHPPSGRLDASHDLDYQPDHVMRDGETHLGDGFTLQAIATPGHASNHLAFALREENGLFSGDHVMAWSTTIVAPPDGKMQDYMASLERLRERDDKVYWPGHGGPLHEPQRFVRGLAVHRRQRETSILARLAMGDTTIPQIVAAIYEALDPRLTGAAGLSVLAHLEDLVRRGLVKTDRGSATPDAHYTV